MNNSNNNFIDKTPGIQKTYGRKILGNKINSINANFQMQDFAPASSSDSVGVADCTDDASVHKRKNNSSQNKKISKKKITAEVTHTCNSLSTDSAASISSLSGDGIFNQQNRMLSKAGVFQSVSRGKQTLGDLNEIMTKSHVDDVNFLYDTMKNYRSSSHGLTFKIIVPNLWNYDAKSRLNNWLSLLGFSISDIDDNDCAIFEIQTNKLDLLKNAIDRLKIENERLTKSDAQTFPVQSRQEKLFILLPNGSTELANQKQKFPPRVPSESMDDISSDRGESPAFTSLTSPFSPQFCSNEDLSPINSAMATKIQARSRSRSNASPLEKSLLKLNIIDSSRNPSANSLSYTTRTSSRNSFGSLNIDQNGFNLDDDSCEGIYPFDENENRTDGNNTAEMRPLSSMQLYSIKEVDQSESSIIMEHNRNDVFSIADAPSIKSKEIPTHIALEQAVVFAADSWPKPSINQVYAHSDSPPPKLSPVHSEYCDTAVFIKVIKSSLSPLRPLRGLRRSVSEGGGIIRNSICNTFTPGGPSTSLSQSDVAFCTPQADLSRWAKSFRFLWEDSAPAPEVDIKILFNKFNVNEALENTKNNQTDQNLSLSDPPASKNDQSEGFTIIRHPDWKNNRIITRTSSCGMLGSGLGNNIENSGRQRARSQCVRFQDCSSNSGSGTEDNCGMLTGVIDKGKHRYSHSDSSVNNYNYNDFSDVGMVNVNVSNQSGEFYRSPSQEYLAAQSESMSISFNTSVDDDNMWQHHNSSHNDSFCDSNHSFLREKKKLQRSRSKQLRMSIGSSAHKRSVTKIDDMKLETIQEPSHVPSVASNNILKRQSNKFSVDPTSISFNSKVAAKPKDFSAMDVDFSMNEAVNLKLNNLNFKCIVIGGVYQHRFDMNAPVIAAPSVTEKRVIGLEFNGTSLLLNLYLPTENSFKLIDLGCKWTWMRASPTGFVICKSTIQPFKKMVCYFLPRHPCEWCVDSKSVIPLTVHDSNLISGVDIMNRDQRIVEFIDKVAAEHVNDVSYLNISSDNNFITDLSSNHNEHRLSLQFESNDTLSVLLASNVNWLNSNLMALILQYLIGENFLNNVHGLDPIYLSSFRTKKSRDQFEKSYNESKNQLKTFSLVCKSWAISTFILTSNHLSNFEKNKNMSFSYDKWCHFVEQYRNGRFISQGCCKTVFRIKNIKKHQYEAISVMDIKDLQDRDMDEAINNELEISMICSSLVTLKICPNLVQVFSLFQSDYGAPTTIWDMNAKLAGTVSPVSNSKFSNMIALPKKSRLSKGRYQFIRMEYCGGGDVEELVRNVSLLNLSQLRSFLFQMCYAVYTCRDKMSLRHYDIKLLNFFVSSCHSLASSNNILDVDNFDMLIGYSKYIFKIPLREQEHDVVKLADFGTSAIGPNGLGDPITIQQFTTLENTPPEFLILGSDARQCYSSDTFSLGLCFFHLIAGYEPYEELLKNVSCPSYLRKQLNNIWMRADENNEKHKPYEVIRQVIESLDDSDYDDNNNLNNNEDIPASILCDTLYRYVVLFGLPSDFVIGSLRCMVYTDNPIMDTLFEGIVGQTTASIQNANDIKKQSFKYSNSYSKMEKSKLDCQVQYLRDSAKWSIRNGNEPKIIDARNRLNNLGDNALDLLISMTNFDPSR
eukprot:gene12115-16221_t